MKTASSSGSDQPIRAGSATSDAARRASLAGACWTLYTLTLRQHMHGKRWLAIALLFLLPAGLALLVRIADPVPPARLLEFVLAWVLVPQAILPLVALLYSSGLIQDEQEDQTITYLLIRPIPKWLLYTTKLAATATTTVVLVVVLVTCTYAAIYSASDTEMAIVLPRGCKAAAILSLAAVTYCSLFGAISMVTKRTLIVGVLYTAIVEGLLASVPLSLRWGTVIYYTRLLAYRSLDFLITWPRGRTADVADAAWFLNAETDPALTEHPQLSTCIWVQLAAILLLTMMASWLCSRSEFHVKTPEKE